jgi:hypothetical protein
VKTLPIENLLKEEIKGINIGLKEFFDALIVQGVTAVHVDWKPPAQGDQEMVEILSKLL